MKFTNVIDENREEEVIVYSHHKSPLAEKIESIVSEYSIEFIGYSDEQIIRFEITDVFCFTVEDNKIYALTQKGKLNVKLRLYRLEEKLPENFIKINQSCIANIKNIEKFDTSVSGTLMVIFKNGYKEYVSRRNIKSVKERLGF